MNSKSSNHFKSRSISVVKDLSIDEQLYLYKKTGELKEAIRTNSDLSCFKINDLDTAIYIIFLEDSTRTKESFKNAAQFHTTRLNIMDARYSSFNKSESYADTFKMLCGYNKYSIFIIRTQLEGVCPWLEQSLGEYAKRHSIDKPAFINGGDGKHEHPTQEFLDQYTFFEQKQGNLDHIHIALIGDLYHGRTAHSKVEGLKIYKNVTVDLIAPGEISMPRQYTEKMEKYGYQIKTYPSIDAYLGQKNIADIWYFTRLQLERMGEDVKEKAEQLSDAVTFKKEFTHRVPSDVRFFHPLPRNKENPTLPTFLDNTNFNGWEAQAINGYYTRIIEIGMLGGKIGDDFSGESPEVPTYIDDFIEEIKPAVHPTKDIKIGIKPIEHGIVIDHIGKGDDVKTIWEHINKTRKILQLNIPHSQGVFCSQKTNKMKGMISIPDVIDLDEKNIKKLAAIAPECTLNFITNQHVIKKLKLHMPPRVYNFEEITCNNKECISYYENHENIITEFFRSGPNTFVCKFCERHHAYKEIWRK